MVVVVVAVAGVAAAVAVVCVAAVVRRGWLAGVGVVLVEWTAVRCGSTTPVDRNWAMLLK